RGRGMGVCRAINEIHHTLILPGLCTQFVADSRQASKLKSDAFKTDESIFTVSYFVQRILKGTVP
ncbi:MAG: hypothetical protein OXI77_02535, partial [Chloroflexota bacterium]|nr:hypothetical protein [Chloroflexota bacterium]